MIGLSHVAQPTVTSAFLLTHADPCRPMQMVQPTTTNALIAERAYQISFVLKPLYESHEDVKLLGTFPWPIFHFHFHQTLPCHILHFHAT